MTHKAPSNTRIHDDKICRIIFTRDSGDAENARPENAGLELSAPYSRGGKCGTGKFGNRKRMERHVWHNLFL